MASSGRLGSAAEIAELVRGLRSFLVAHRALFCFSNVRVLAERRLQALPDGWLTVLETSRTRDLLSVFSEGACDRSEIMKLGSLAGFVRKRARLLHLLEGVVKKRERGSEKAPPSKGMTPKKAMEVEVMAPAVAEVCSGADTVVDVGCGLAHLSSALSASGLRVVAVEADARLCQGAADKLKGDGDGVLVRARLSEDATELPEEVKRHLQGDRAHVLVGLHSCGDLGPTVMRIFSGDPKTRAIVLASCCYHKMQRPGNLSLSEGNAEEAGELLSPPVLRLACQESLARWHSMSDAELEERARFLGFRAVLEDFCQSSGLSLSKQRRRGAKKVSLVCEADYAGCVIASYDLASQVADQQALQSALVAKLKESRSLFRTLMNLNVVQLSLQSLIEYVILLDRCLFLMQSGCEVELIEMFDPVISPRNKVIVAYK